MWRLSPDLVSYSAAVSRCAAKGRRSFPDETAIAGLPAQHESMKLHRCIREFSELPGAWMTFCHSWLQDGRQSAWTDVVAF